MEQSTTMPLKELPPSGAKAYDEGAAEGGPEEPKVSDAERIAKLEARVAELRRVVFGAHSD
jgi:hypothetical protein